VSITINGQGCTMMVEARSTLLDALRGEMGLTGTKKGCDRGDVCSLCRLFSIDAMTRPRLLSRRVGISS